MSNSVIIWDQPDVPSASMDKALLWQSYANSDSFFSIPHYLEGHAEQLRARYLTFIYDLGERKVKGKSIADHLDIMGGGGFWWMTTLAEKNPFKSPRIYDCLRLMALEEILLERKPGNLTLVSSDRVLAQAMRTLCQNLHISFFWRAEKKSTQKYSLRGFYDTLPFLAQGLISLVRHIILRWTLRKLHKPEWFSGNDSIFFCSYFFNLDAGSCNNGHFYSRQWEGLPQYLHKSGKRTNWIHHLLLNASAPNANKGMDWMRLFNRDRYHQGCHAFLDTFLSVGVVLRAFKNWLWLNIICWRLRNIHNAFTPNGASVCLWPLLQRDWQTSLSGPVALNNCLWVELFDTALKEIPYQKIGLYLWENQGWENALLRAWRRHGHGEIIGVPHATIAFWHLNNFDDVRTLASSNICAKPLPNHWAINGPMAWNAFAELGYPVEKFVKVEALRFQYLSAYSSTEAEKLGAHPRYACVSGQDFPKKILIIGGGFVDENHKMLQCVEAALQLMNIKIFLTIKPHPICHIKKEDYPALSFELTDKPLAEIMRGFDFAFSCNTSSAGLDALLAGLPVVIFLKEGDFNHSPLRGIKGVQFANTGQELAAALLSIKPDRSAFTARDFFWLDSQLPRWQKLLSTTRDQRISAQ